MECNFYGKRYPSARQETANISNLRSSPMHISERITHTTGHRNKNISHVTIFMYVTFLGNATFLH
jgi:hypothetical protein